MDKCPKCGAGEDASEGAFSCGTRRGVNGTVKVSGRCLRRQLAAANERVAALQTLENDIETHFTVFADYDKHPELMPERPSDPTKKRIMHIRVMRALSALREANERAGRLEELRKDAWAMLLAIASGNGPFEKKMTRADMMEAARQAAEALEVPDAM